MTPQLAQSRKTGIKTKQQTPIRRASKSGSASPKNKRLVDLRLKVTPILKPYVNRISLFGSFARGDAQPSSDIDLLIALKPAEARPALGLFGFIELEQKLAKKLGREVDLVTEDGLNPRRRKNIEKDKVILYEAK